MILTKGILRSNRSEVAQLSSNIPYMYMYTLYMNISSPNSPICLVHVLIHGTFM